MPDGPGYLYGQWLRANARRMHCAHMSPDERQRAAFEAGLTIGRGEPSVSLDVVAAWDATQEDARVGAALRRSLARATHEDRFIIVDAYGHIAVGFEGAGREGAVADTLVDALEALAERVEKEG